VDDWERAADLVAGHCAIACLTRSEKGSVVITAEGERLEVPARLVGPVVDTTGAGDQYAAGFLYGYTHGHDLATSGALASLAAGEVISHVGARPEQSLADLSRNWRRD
jgi:sugar/nucleoside kinase (ribokinase family)